MSRCNVTLSRHYRPRTYVRREVMFSQVCVCSGGVPHLRSGGVPHLRSGGVGGYPISGLGGYPISGRGWGVPHLRSGGYPISGLGGVLHLRSRGVPHLRSRGVPHLRSGGGTPSQVWGVPQVTPPPPGIASTCYGYAAGGMPLAFTQEDFLVSFVSLETAGTKSCSCIPLKNILLSFSSLFQTFF